MKQFILKSEPENGIVRLDGNDYRYLVRVRRLAAGECFTAVLPDGKETQVRILSVNGSTLTGEINAVSACIHTKSSANLPPIILFQALPKSDKMDTIVRQAAEGGITEIVPFVSEFSAYNTGKSKKGGSIINEQKFTRWERIIKEARQQSGSKIQTRVRKPLTIEGLIVYWGEIKKTSDTLGLLFHHIALEGLENKSLHGYLSNISGDSSPAVVLAVGPEGGFSESEVSLFLDNGFKPITVGDTVLRTDTASIYFSAAVRVLLLERDSWEMK